MEQGKSQARENGGTSQEIKAETGNGQKTENFEFFLGKVICLFV